MFIIAFPNYTYEHFLILNPNQQDNIVQIKAFEKKMQRQLKPFG